MKNILISGLMLLALNVPKADATIITFAFTGNVTLLGSGVIGGPANIGDLMSGYFSFDPTVPIAPPPSSFPGFDRHNGTFTDFSLNVGGYHASFFDTAFNFMGIANASATSGEHFDGQGNFSGANINGLFPDAFAFSLNNSIIDTFSSGALPLTPPPLSNFSSAYWFISFVETPGDSTGYSIFGNLTSLTLVNNVLAPATLPLLLVGFAGLGLARITRKAA